ncbi:MAG TPA: alpha/beta fold hydrolase [Jatrophihabitantaceae bacterium]
MKRLLALLAAAATTLTLTVGAVASDAAEPSHGAYPAPPTLSLHWAACDGGFECATARVPLDYHRPHGATITLPMIRKPAADPAHRIGSLFLLPGGPGQSGVGIVRTTPPPFFALLGRFDVVSFDPRGVAGSRPAIDCDSNVDPNFVFDPPDEVDRHALVARVRDYVGDCARANGALLSHVGTGNVARDLDLMRAAVGDPKLNAVGISYGSIIGAAYASMFPGRSRALVLGSAVDAGAWFNRPIEYAHVQAGGFEQALRRFFLRCAAAGAACGFGGADPQTAFDSLVATLHRNPLTSTDPQHPGRLNDHIVLDAALNAVYSINVWPDFAHALSAAAAGNAGPMLAFAADVGAVSGNHRRDQPLAVGAVDTRYPASLARYFRAAEHDFGSYDHYWGLQYDNLFGALWPASDPDVFRGPIHNPKQAPTILVIGNTYDPAAPYVGAKRLTAELGNARLLTFQADGHASLTTGNPCLLGATLAYLHDPDVLPDPGASCIDERNPFPPAPG